MAGTITGSEVSKRYGEEGLPEDTITLRFTGSAGQSFGAFVPKGMSMYLTGDANDYIGKGLSGGKIAVKAPDNSACIAGKMLLSETSRFTAQQAEKLILTDSRANDLPSETAESALSLKASETMDVNI